MKAVQKETVKNADFAAFEITPWEFQYDLGMNRDSHADRGKFCTTNWSLVHAASGAEKSAALTQLCQAYWYPVYSFIRRSGENRNEAEDLTQGFFAKLLEKDYLADADRARGRFRTFLLASVKHFLSNERDFQKAVKRGGRVKHLSLDFEEAEARYSIEPTDGWTAEAIYERNWALSLLREVFLALETEYTEAGKGDLFAALTPYLTGQPTDGSLSEIAVQLETTGGALKVAAHRLRKSYRQRLREAVAATLDGSDDVEAERRLLMDAMAGK
ncbi:MAG: RNA polymerase sigma factor [Rubripirellula sp.]